MFRKLKRTWSNGYGNFIPRFHEVFPELKGIDREEMCDRFITLDIEFYSEEKTPVSFWVRLTFPFLLVLVILMIVFLPVHFLISGRWRYPLHKMVWLKNWIRAVGF